MASTGNLRNGAFNTKSPTIKRILQESRELSLFPDPTITAAPLETNLFEWHFTMTGPPSSPYTDGVYHGRIVLPPSYPLRPPSFRFLTPSGRFEVNREICLSISGHHEETWQPAWGIRTALCAIRAFMAGDAKGQVGGLDMDSSSRENLARESHSWRCIACGDRTNGELIKECEEEWRKSHRGEARKEILIPEDLELNFREDLSKNTETKASYASRYTENAIEKGEDQHSDCLLSAGNCSHSSEEASRLLEASQMPGSQTQEPSAAKDRGNVSFKTTATSNGSAASSARNSTAGTSAAPPSSPQAETLVHDRVPTWVDKAILGVVLTLLFMSIKKFVGWSNL